MGRHVEWRNAKDFFIPYERERATVKERYGRDDWHYRLLKWVHSHGVQLTLALLLALDVLVLIVELILGALHPSCAIVLERCAASNDTSALVSELSVSDQCVPFCSEEPHWLHPTHEFLFWTSISILIIFLAELFLLVCAVGPLLFVRNFFYLFDLVIVATSLALELALRAEIAEDVGGLLIFVRLWRLLRISHGIFTDTHEHEHHHIGKLEKEIKHLKREVEQLRTQLGKPSFVLPSQQEEEDGENEEGDFQQGDGKLHADDQASLS